MKRYIFVIVQTHPVRDATLPRCTDRILTSFHGFAHRGRLPDNLKTPARLAIQGAGARCEIGGGAGPGLAAIVTRRPVPRQEPVGPDVEVFDGEGGLRRTVRTGPNCDVSRPASGF